MNQAVAENRAGRISHSFESCNQRLNELEENMAELTSRLVPILGPTNPGPPTGATPSKVPQVSVADQLIGLSDRVAGINAHVSDLLQRIEL